MCITIYNKHCVCASSHPSSTKDAFRLSRGAWDSDRVVITSSRKPTSSFRSSSCDGDKW